MAYKFEELFPKLINDDSGNYWTCRPKGVSGHRIVCDQEGDGIYLVGGWNMSFLAPNSENEIDRHYVREVWKFNTAKQIWTQLKSVNPPSSLASHCLTNLGRTIRDGQSRLLICGGSLSSRGISGNSNETFIYHVGEERWDRLTVTGTLPAIENGHWFGRAMAKRGRFIYVASGRSTDFSDNIDRMELHRLNLQTLIWEALSLDNDDESPPPPPCRVRHEIIVDEEEKIYIFGGAIDFQGVSYDLIDIPYFDVKKDRRWHLLKTLPDSTAGYPKPRSCFGCVLYGDYVYVVGGHYLGRGDNANPFEMAILDDFWRLHLSNGQWTKISINLPRPLWFHAVDVDSDGFLYIYGGCPQSDYATRTDQLWRTKLVLPSLKRLAWETVIKNISPTIGKINDEDLLNKLSLPPSVYLSKLKW